MSQTDSLTDEQLIAQGMSVAVHARLTPDRVAIISQNGNLTWAQLNAHANRLVHLLRRRGLQPGDGVALLAHNGPEFVEVWAAAQRAGFRLTAVNWHQSPEVVAYVVDNCDAKAHVASGRFAVGASEAAKAGIDEAMARDVARCIARARGVTSLC